ncbi:Receptor protein 12 [Spatholobus suberectus]|nr:Receptor protein 12 [Spatholobus suberectus]
MAAILLWFLYASTLFSCMVNGNMNVLCNGKDQHELSVFKQSIKDPLKRLSSWSTEQDCCKWSGVHCDNITGRVSKLDLHCPLGTIQCLEGEINFSVVFKLEFLRSLDLSFNNFETIHFPPIHDGYANFSNLLYLDLSMNYNLHMENLRWLSPLSSLKYLNLSGIFLKSETLWLQQMTMPPSLIELRLSGCSLNGDNLSLWYVSFTSLEVLDISNNSLHYEIPKWLSNLQHLRSLILGSNQLKGLIPKWMGQFKYLEQLDLSNNLLSGPIPSTFGSLSSLKSLEVSFNKLNGSLPRDIGKLSLLEVLSIGYNSFSGTISEQSFSKLSNLKSLSLDSSDFIFDLASHWQPPFQLEKISLSYCKLGPEFPSWLYSQKSLSYLDISSSGLSFNIHEDLNFWSFVAQIDNLFLSYNSISGDISASLINNTQIDLKWNNFSGRLPHLSPKVIFFDIANNTFSGSIVPFLCQGEHHLEVLDMSHNFLSGELPNCWMKWQSLLHVNLGSNNLSGKIPHSIGSLSKLQTFRVRNNSLIGNIPISLKSCKSLWYLDLGLNEFTGIIPTWFSHLSMALLLRSNKFSGTIPLHICELSSLLVLDLANNGLSGPIPKCLHNITTMVTNTVDEGLFMSYFRKWFLAPISARSNLEDLPLFMKGQELNYWHALKFVHSVDLSSNDLSGPIPLELVSLSALQSLNLSQNRLEGKIPNGIGNMKYLESLDLSRNQLSGEIPQSMSNLSFLSSLNLSYNHFSGQIPLGTQLQSFDAFSYIGNPQLCGDPLPKKCTQERTPYHSFKSMHDKYDDDFKSWFGMGMGIGFASAFWGVLGTLFFVRRWRDAYFRALHNLYLKVKRFW